MNNTLTITQDKLSDINNNMIGLFFEDINYSADGGLYAEMIENNSFEFLKSLGTNDNYYQEPAYDYGWSSYPENSAKLYICSENGISCTNPHFLRFSSTKACHGFSNKAYTGIALKNKHEYIFSFYARSQNYTDSLIITIKNKNETACSHSITPKFSTDWTKYSFTLTAENDIKNAQLIIELTNEGVIDFDMISLMPKDAVSGIFRKDLFDMLKEMKPGFLRFPGGCIVEGNTLENRYKWKDSIGDISCRKANWSRWAVHTNEDNKRFPYYNQSLGLGYYEYFLLCELLNAKPIPIVNVGVACEYQSHETVDINSEEFKNYIEDTLDLIEFANGTDINNIWVRKRIEMGHPKPFNLEYLGIGNEQWEVHETQWNGKTYKVDFFARYEAFEKEIHSKYPEIKLLGTAGPNVLDEHYKEAWDWARAKFLEKGKNFMYAMDEHYYKSSAWCRENTHFYDNYPRNNINIFVGEYAAGDNTWEAALSEAAYLTGMERNCDIVKLVSYAPLFARINYTQWQRANMIYFDDTSVYGTPNYYVHKLFSNNLGSYTLKTALQNDDKNLFQTASFDEKTKEIIVKLVNLSDEEKQININFEKEFEENISCTVLKADSLKAVNSIENPKSIYPQKFNLNFKQTINYSIPKYSLSILRIKIID